MTTPQDTQAALDALDCVEKTLNALLSNPARPQVFGLPAIDIPTIRSVLQSHAPAHDAVDLENLKDKAPDGHKQDCICIRCERKNSWNDCIDHLAPRLARMDDPFNLPDGYDVYVIGRNHEDGYWIEVRDTKNNILARDMGMRILHENTMAELFSAAREMILESEWYNDGQYSVKAPQQKKGE